MKRPNNNNFQNLLQIRKTYDFLSMLNWVDCMKWEWKNYPVVWKAQYTQGDHGELTIMLEAIATQDM